MATPVGTGTMAILTEPWRKTTTNPTGRPSPVMLKALAIAGADDIGIPGPDYTYGFGLLDAKKSVDLIIADGGTGKRIKADNAAQGAIFDYPLTLTSTQDLRIVLSWFDPEALPVGTEDVTEPTLINDLDVKLVGPSGTTLPYVLDKDDPCYTSGVFVTCKAATTGVNKVDNNEEIELKGAAAGTYHVIVNGTRVTANPPQPFILVSSADLGEATPPCTDPTEPNDTTPYVLTLNVPVSPRICSATDVDLFTFKSNKVGTVTVTIAATDAPLTVSLIGGGGSTSKTIAANTTNTVTLPVSTATPTSFTVNVTASAPPANGSGYTISANFPFSAPNRRRGTTH